MTVTFSVLLLKCYIAMFVVTSTDAETLTPLNVNDLYGNTD